jgi:hypothetical protein
MSGNDKLWIGRETEMARTTQLDRYRERELKQREWIEHCENSGSYTGENGPAIRDADLVALKKIVAQRKELEMKKREYPGIEWYETPALPVIPTEHFIVTDWAAREIDGRGLHLTTLAIMHRARGTDASSFLVAPDLWICFSSHPDGQTFVFMSTVENAGTVAVTIPLELEN